MQIQYRKFKWKFRKLVLMPNEFNWVIIQIKELTLMFSQESAAQTILSQKSSLRKRLQKSMISTNIQINRPIIEYKEIEQNDV